MKILEECDGYKSLLASVMKDKQQHCGHMGRDDDSSPDGYMGTFHWAIERAKHYGEKLNLDPADILDAWEKRRNYWYMNFYQDCNQPLITHSNVRVFETLDDLIKAMGNQGFRCPACGGVSKSPYECDSGKIVKGKKCDWKSYGLFGCMGKGICVFIKEKLVGQEIFMPVSLENQQENNHE